MFSAVNPFVRAASMTLGRGMMTGAATPSSFTPAWSTGDLGPPVWGAYNSPESQLEALKLLPEPVRAEQKRQMQHPTAASSTQWGAPPEQGFADKLQGMFRGGMPFGGMQEGATQALPPSVGGPQPPSGFPGEQTPSQRVMGGFSEFGMPFGNGMGEMPPSQRVAGGFSAFGMPFGNGMAEPSTSSAGQPLDIRPPQAPAGQPLNIAPPQQAAAQMLPPPPPAAPPQDVSRVWLQRDRETGEYLDPRMAALAEKAHGNPFAGLFG